MKYILLIVFGLFINVIKGQSISGIINNYASVTGATGSSIVVGTTAGFAVGDQILIIQMQGASVVTLNNITFGNITSYGGAGTYEFKNITAISGLSITVNSPLTNTYDVVNGATQIVRVPVMCQPTVTSTLNCTPWNGTTGGVLALEAGTLTLNSDLNVNAAGFRGGNFASSSFCCSIGNFAGPFNINGGKKGESISKYIVGQDGMKGKQANGGGGSNCGNSGGGGGGNAGAGGIGGNQYNGCGGFDERGLGGLNLTTAPTSLFMGGGGGGGFRDNGNIATNGGNGGGIIFIKANQIIGNNRLVSANGGSVTIIANGEGAGGGGGGGSIFIACNNYVGNLNVTTNGGNGGSNFNTIFANNCHGPGGGGGGGLYAFSSPALPIGITYQTFGGAAGTVNNPLSTCFGTTFGAAAGLNGGILPSLPTTTMYAMPTLTVASTSSICAGQSSILSSTATSSSFTWSPSSSLTSASSYSVLATPSITTIYTVTVGNGICITSLDVTVSVTPSPTVTISASTNTLCVTQTSTLSGFGATSYSWVPSSTSLSALTSSMTIATPTITSTYTLIGTVGGCTNSAITTVSVIPSPITAILSGTNTTCGACNGIINATPAMGVLPYTYSWSPSVSTQSVITDLCADNYSVTITDNNKCKSTFSFSVLPSLIFDVDLTASNTEIYAGEPVSLIGSAGASFTWSPINDLSCIDCISTIATPSNDITYCIDVTSVDGCVDYACVEIIIKCGEVFVPNAFSPNNDGHNDELTVYGNCIKDIVFRIFDRWGEMVYESFDPKEKWDGKYKGYEVTAGVFVYQFTAKLKSGEFITKNGNITVVK